MTIPPCEVRTLPLEQLQPAAYNPRHLLKPTDAAYQKLRTSLQQFGLVEPLVWNQRSGHVVGGHARLRILQELGVREALVSVVDLNDEQEKALNIVLNNQEAQGQFDRKKLKDILEELQDLPEFEWTGFDDDIFRTLDFEANPVAEPVASQADVEVILKIPHSIWPTLQMTIDELIREYDLVAHVQMK